MTIIQQNIMTEEERNQREALKRLEEAGGKLTATEDITFEGTKMILPRAMDIPGALRFLQEKLEEDEMRTDYDRTYTFRWRDGAAAVDRVCKKIFGGISQRPLKFMFFGQEIVINPEQKTIASGYGETMQVPWGHFVIPLLNDVVFELDASRTGNLIVKAVGPRKHRYHVEGFFRAVQAELEHNSIYRGQAFDGGFDFLNLATVDENKVVYADEIVEQLEANVWSLLRYSQAQRDAQMPLKRTVLFEGPYGTGKTLGAFLTAKIAKQNSWTFIMARPQDDFKEAIETARMYQPAVIFFEDVDTVSSSGEADSVSKLLDTFDGMAAKGSEVVCVVTTNHVEKIHKGMIRPGRLDAVIHIGALDAKGIKTLVNSIVSPEDIDGEIEWDSITSAMEGFLPAFAKEAIDRTVRYNLSRNKGVRTKLTTADFVNAAKGLRPQLELMNEATEGTHMPLIDTAFRELFSDNRLELDGVALDYDGDKIYDLELKADVK